MTTVSQESGLFRKVALVSAIHFIVQLGARIIAMQPPQTPRTTYNIGMVEGGQSINSIATEASMWLDLRSEAYDALANLEQHVRHNVKALSGDDVSFTIEVVGDRPAGTIATTHPLVVRAQAAPMAISRSRKAARR